jgi:hypothetical protein
MSRFSNAAILSILFLGSSSSFVPSFLPTHYGRRQFRSSSSFLVKSDDDISTSTTHMIYKPTGTSFLPKDTIERAKAGSPIEKIKLAKDGTSAFVDVYDYARKILAGEMTWEEVEKGDLDTVSIYILKEIDFISFLIFRDLIHQHDYDFSV